MSFLVDLFTFFTTPPGSWLYTLILLVAVEAAAAMAWRRWSSLRRLPPGGSSAAQHRSAHARLAVCAGLLYALYGLGLAAALLIPAGSPDALIALPPFERATIALTALLLGWALAYPSRAPRADRVGLGLSLALLASLALSWQRWSQAVVNGASFFNGTANETMWLLVGAVFLTGALWRVNRRRLAGWRWAVALLAVLLAAHALQYMFPVAGLDAPAAIRWAMLLVLPAAMALLYRRAQDWPDAATGRPRPVPPGPLPVASSEALAIEDTQPNAAQRAPLPAAPTRFKSPLRLTTEALLLTALIYVGIEFASGRFRVDGPSMQPTLHAGQFLLTDKLAYWLGRPQRGDIVVVHPEAEQFAAGGFSLVKRVIGLPGETITVATGQVYINGQLYPELYVTEAPAYSGAWRLGDEQYFVLGDNRNNSSDSHIWGPLERRKVTSRALLIYWPPSAWVWVAHTPLAAAGR